MIFVFIGIQKSLVLVGDGCAHFFRSIGLAATRSDKCHKKVHCVSIKTCIISRQVTEGDQLSMCGRKQKFLGFRLKSHLHVVYYVPQG